MFLVGGIWRMLFLRFSWILCEHYMNDLWFDSYLWKIFFIALPVDLLFGIFLIYGCITTTCFTYHFIYPTFFAYLWVLVSVLAYNAAYVYYCIFFTMFKKYVKYKQDKTYIV